MLKLLGHRAPGFALIGLLLISGAYLLCAPSAPVPLGSIPSRIILTWSGDSATTQSVTWQTSTALTTPQAQVAKSSPYPNFEATATTVTGTVTSTVEPGHYVVNLKGLDPATAYLYRVGDGKTWSEWNAFLTASTKPEPFRFLYVGDAQNNIKSMWSRTIRAAYATAPDARFIAYAGDLLAEGYDDRLWGEWCDALGFISATIPSLPAPGNHDLHRPPGSPGAKTALSVSYLWKQHFALPDNGPEAPELKGQSYFVDYQGARIIVLDVNVFANESFDPESKRRVWNAQMSWLYNALVVNRQHWTIVVQHQPIYAMAKGRDYKEMRAALTPLFETYGVDLVLQGHDHHYSRSHKIAQGRIVDAAAPGVVYAISVSGPKMYEVQETNRKLMANVVEQTQCFQVIEVTPAELKYVAYSADGAIIDRFALRKSGNLSTYVNQAPSK